MCRRCGGIALFAAAGHGSLPQTEQPAAIQILGVLLLQTYPDGVVAEAAVVKQLAHELPQPQIPALHGAGLAHLSGGGKIADGHVPGQLLQLTALAGDGDAAGQLHGGIPLHRRFLHGGAGLLRHPTQGRKASGGGLVLHHVQHMDLQHPAAKQPHVLDHQHRDILHAGVDDQHIPPHQPRHATGLQQGQAAPVLHGIVVDADFHHLPLEVGKFPHILLRQSRSALQTLHQFSGIHSVSSFLWPDFGSAPW